jgi:nicotinamidase-related amidase
MTPSISGSERAKRTRAAKGGAALVLIDVINPMDFEGSEGLVKAALPAAEALLALKRRARRHGVPTIYVNDNFGRWRSDFRAIVALCARRSVPGGAVARLLKPEPRDYFVLKPKHSGFHATALETLLQALKVRTLILGGFATNICVLFTANDAYMRGYRIRVPADCVAANSPTDTRQTLAQMRTFLKADVRPSKKLDFA